MGHPLLLLSNQESKIQGFGSGFEADVADSADEVVGGGFALFHG
jgi:hypothetical protein